MKRTPLVEVVDLTLDISDDEDYEALLTRTRTNVNGPNSGNWKIPNVDDPVEAVSGTMIKEDVFMDGELNLPTPRKTRISDDFIEFEVDEVEERVPEDDQEQLLIPPPLLSPIITIATAAAVAEQPCTSSKVFRDAFVMPLLQEYFVDTPVNSPHNASLPKTRKRSGTPVFTQEQTNHLKAAFQKCTFIRGLDFIELLNLTGLTKLQIQRWFSQQRQMMKRHEAHKDENRAWKKRQSDPTPTTAGFTVSWGESTNLSDPHSNSKKYRKSEPNLSTRVQSDDDVALVETTESERVQSRMQRINKFSVEMISKVLEEHQERVLGLVALYMRPKLDMKKTLVTETKRLKEMSLSESPFSPLQQEWMKAWQKRFFKNLMSSQTSLNTDKKSQFDFVKHCVVDIWLPVIVYGKLLNRSLESSIRDFTYSSAGRMKAGVGVEYSIPGILRGIKNILE